MANSRQRPPKTIAEPPRRFSATDAYALLASELSAYREFSYEQLVGLVETRDTRVVQAKDSVNYAIEVVVRWKSGVPGDICVDGWVAVDDCGPLRRLDDHFVVVAPPNL